jgi:hypothetical protein
MPTASTYAVDPIAPTSPPVGTSCCAREPTGEDDRGHEPRNDGAALTRERQRRREGHGNTGRDGDLCGEARRHEAARDAGECGDEARRQGDIAVSQRHRNGGADGDPDQAAAVSHTAGALTLVTKAWRRDPLGPKRARPSRLIDTQQRYAAHLGGWAAYRRRVLLAQRASRLA